MRNARFAETMYWLIYCDLEESTKLKQYLTSDFSIKFVVEPNFKYLIQLQGKKNIEKKAFLLTSNCRNDMKSMLCQIICQLPNRMD
jgi:hypothetical protein